MLALLLGIEITTLFLGIKSFGNKNNTIDDIKLLDDKSNNLFAVMIDDGNGNYSETNTFPTTGYKLNIEKSICTDNSGEKIDLTLEFNDGIVSLDTEKTIYCYLYFDKKNNTVYDKITSDYVNNNGVSKTTDETGKEIYYYKGSITNNNLVLNNYCWKMVRTSETDGVKLLYNETYSESNKCNNTGSSTQVGKSYFNNGNTIAGSSPAYVGYMYNKVYALNEQTLTDTTTNYYFGNNVTYSSSTSKYTLKTIKRGTLEDMAESVLANYGYTCLTTSTTCYTVYYIISSTVSKSTGLSQKIINRKIYYYSLTGGMTISTAVESMLHASDVNKTNSAIKTVVDNWYKTNMTNVTNYLENAIFCNNRTITSFGVFNPNSNNYNANNMLTFDSTKLTCSNKNDQFTLSVENGGEEGYGNNALNYPVGLLNYSEAKLVDPAGYIKSGENYLLLTPAAIGSFNNTYFVNSSGSITGIISQNLGVRPVISLKKEIEITGGTGEIEEPYTVSFG